MIDHLYASELLNVVQKRRPRGQTCHQAQNRTGRSNPALRRCSTKTHTHTNRLNPNPTQTKKNPTQTTQTGFFVPSSDLLHVPVQMLSGPPHPTLPLSPWCENVLFPVHHRNPPTGDQWIRQTKGIRHMPSPSSIPGPRDPSNYLLR